MKENENRQVVPRNDFLPIHWLSNSLFLFFFFGFEFCLGNSVCNDCNIQLSSTIRPLQSYDCVTSNDTCHQTEECAFFVVTIHTQTYTFLFILNA